MSEDGSFGCLNTPSYSRSGSKAPSMMTQDLVKAELDIVLLGEIGVGKSSLVNMITGGKVASVSSDTMACTETTARYTLESNGKTFNLYDTPGLVDPQMGTRPFVDPIDKIQQLICRLNDGKGPDLLLFCVDNAKPTAAFKRNYWLFSKVICGGRVPSALVIAKLGEEQNEESWWNEHGGTFKKYGIDRARCIGFRHRKSSSNPNAEVDTKSREAFMSFFVSCIDRRKHGFNSLPFSMAKTLGLIGSFLRSRVSPMEKVLASQCGLDEQTARELTRCLVR